MGLVEGLSSETPAEVTTKVMVRWCSPLLVDGEASGTGSWVNESGSEESRSGGGVDKVSCFCEITLYVSRVLRLI